MQARDFTVIMGPQDYPESHTKKSGVMIAGKIPRNAPKMTNVVGVHFVTTVFAFLVCLGLGMAHRFALLFFL